MPSTYLSLHYHVVFSTKERREWIHPDWRVELHKYMSGTIVGLKGFPQETGVADHVHLLFGLRATHCLSDVVRELKKAATIWVQEEIKLPQFSWQEGYAAFTVSATAREAVKNYIAHQEEHHRTTSFREELIGMLARAGVEYDPRYLD